MGANQNTQTIYLSVISTFQFCINNTDAMRSLLFFTFNNNDSTKFASTLIFFNILASTHLILILPEVGLKLVIALVLQLFSPLLVWILAVVVTVWVDYVRFGLVLLRSLQMLKFRDQILTGHPLQQNNKGRNERKKHILFLQTHPKTPYPTFADVHKKVVF